MKCPHCDKELKVADCVFNNVEMYGRSSLASTDCCGHAVHVSRIVKFNITPYEGDKTEDDWGSPFLPLIKPQDDLAIAVLSLLKDNKLKEALDMLRSISNPLTAGWVVQEVLGELNLPSKQQTKNWLINALYNAK